MINENKKIKELEEENTRLKSSVAELKVLNEIAVSSCKAADIDQILNLIVQKSINAVEAEQGVILLTTKNENEPLATFVRQDDTSSLKHNYHIGTNITGWVLLNKKPLIIENLSEDKRFKPTEEEKKKIHSALCVPIWFEGEIIGVMMLINKKNEKYFSQNDLTLFSIISVQAGQLIKNLELQKETLYERKETEKLQEMDKLKTNFFTNISHEFRTPLTLILGPAKQILEKTEEKKIKNEAELIIKSAKKLNLLANQLLDLSRIEAGQMKLKVVWKNLIPLIKEVVSSFQPFAESKNISLKLDQTAEELFIYLDKDKFDKIISNILSNAIKFTPPGGRVNVKVKTQSLPIHNILKSSLSENKEELKVDFAEIAISDTGIGIPNEQLNKIFNRFYQIDSNISKEYEGTGIGLSLAKELVQLHKGLINVESEKDRGSTFKIFFPTGKKLYEDEEIAEKEFHREGKVEIAAEYNFMIESKTVNGKDFSQDFTRSAKPLLLIVEDNYDVRKYIMDILIEYYRISEAADGEEGINKSFEQIPDLIISDIMMPKVDGLRLCRILKTDLRTSHIPIILLTAKHSILDKIEGYESCADDYIMKPFDASELIARIKNLIRQKKKIHDHYKRIGFLIDEGNVTPIDQNFLKRTFSIINENLSDNNFSVEMLAENLSECRSLVYKKLIALIGESPNDLIKRIRLNKAAKLIEQKSANISQIAFEVGFNNPSYFAKCFQKQFGFSPSQYHHHFPIQN